MGHRRVTPGPGRRVVWWAGIAVAALAGLVVAIVLIDPRGAPAGPQPVGGAVNPTTTTPPSSGSPTGPPRSTATATARPPAARYVFPVAGRVSYARTHHDYPATDILAPCGTAVRAVTDGVILEVNRVDRYDASNDDGALRGGLYVSLLGDDGVRYYGSHLRTVKTGIDKGVRVRAGQQIAIVGDTGDASACHLHFGISPPCARTGDWWVRRGVIWPYSYLDSWRAGGRASPVRAITAWHKAHGCPKSP
jgi:murein DD-endopeptidase MepM/ murein hydrolase activator NlpD